MTGYRLKKHVFRLVIVASGWSCHALANPARVTELDCIIEPEITVELSTSVDGIVQSINVDKSDLVQEGQVLASLESSVEQATVDLARLRSELDEDIQAKKIQRDLSRRKKERIQELYEKKSAPLFEKDEAEAEASLAGLELVRAYNSKKLADLELQRAVATLNLRTVTSPINGVVVERYVHPGESVQDRPLLKLAQIDPLRVEIIASSDLFGTFKQGMEVEVIAEGPSESVHSARVSVIDSVVDAASGTFGVRLSLPNPDNAVVGGVKCRARFTILPAPSGISP